MSVRILFVAVAAACLVSTGSLAAELYPWGADPFGSVVTVMDPSGEEAEDSRDILQLWYAQDTDTHYFRMDLRGAPIQQAGDFAEEYVVQIDSIPGQGGSAANTAYIANGLLDIDQNLVSHFTLSSGHVIQHRHNYLGAASAPPRVDTAMLGTVGGLFDAAEDGGKTLQWSIPFAELEPGPFLFYGATQDISDPHTYDITSAISVDPVPEPATLGLLAMLLVGLAAKRSWRVGT